MVRPGLRVTGLIRLKGAIGAGNVDDIGHAAFACDGKHGRCLVLCKARLHCRHHIRVCRRYVVVFARISRDVKEAVGWPQAMRRIRRGPILGDRTVWVAMNKVRRRCDVLPRRRKPPVLIVLVVPGDELPITNNEAVAVNLWSECEQQ